MKFLAQMVDKALSLIPSQKENDTSNSGSEPIESTNQEKQLASDNLTKLSDLDLGRDKGLVKSLKNQFNLLANSVSTGGLYNVLVGGISPIENNIRTATQEVGGQIFSSVLSHLNAAEGMLHSLLERQKSLTDEGCIIAFLRLHEADKSAEVSKARKPLARINELEQRRIKARDKKERFFQAKEKVLNIFYGGIIPEEITKWIKALLFLLILVFAGGEAVFIYDAIERMVDNSMNDLMRGLTTVSIIVALLFASHKLGQSLNIKTSVTTDIEGNPSTKNWQKYLLPTLLYGAAVIALFAGVCYIRFSTIPAIDMDTSGFSELMGGNGNEGSNDYLFILINLGFLLLVTGLAKYMHRHDDYFSLDRLHSKYLNLEAYYQRKIEQIKAAVAADEKEIESRWMGEAQKHLDEHREKERAEIDSCRLIVSEFRTYLKRQSVSLSDLYENAITELRNNIIFAREREGLEAIEFGNAPIRPLDFYKDLDLSDIYKSSSEKAMYMSQDKASKNGVYNGSIATLSAMILLLGCFLFPSCSDTEQLQPIGKTVAYISDWSIDEKDATLLPSTEAQALFLFKSAGFAPTVVSPDGLTFLTAHIGTTSLAPVYRCELPKTSPDMVKAQRRKQQKAFGLCVYEKIKMQNRQQGLEQSYVGATLNQILPSLAQSEDSIKLCLIASDMVLNNKEVANFYQHGSRLMQHYDVLAGKIEKAYPDLKNIDLTGVKFYSTYLPDEKTDKIAKASRDFWMKWFTSKNATIEFLPNLKEPRLTAQQ